MRVTPTATLLLATLLLFSLSKSSPAAGDHMDIYFLDIGQGDATIIHQPGRCSALIDAGPPLNGYRVTGKLQELGINTLDLVIVTHPHLDHYGGLYDLAPRIEISRYYDNGVAGDNSEYFDNFRLLRRSLEPDVLKAGDTINCGDVSIEILHPRETGKTGTDYNSESIAALVSYGSFRLLAMGDLAGSAENALLEHYRLPKTDVIKIAHHGAADATSNRLLELTNPDLAIISTETENRINSPSPAVLERLEKHNISYYRTDRDGTIKLSTTGKSFRASATGAKISE